MHSKPLKNILFPTDFSQQSLQILDQAIMLAEKSGSKLIILNIVDTPFDFNIENEPVEIDLILSEQLKISSNKLETLKNKIVSRNFLKVDVATYSGETSASITRAAINLNADLIMMGSKVKKDNFFKSKIFNIVKNTSIPILSLNPASLISNYKNILFPFNEQFLTIQKADEVIQFAKIWNSKIILLGIAPDVTLEHRQALTTNGMSLKNIFDNNDIENELHFDSNPNYSKGILNYCSIHSIHLVTIINHLHTVLKENLNNVTAEEVINLSEIPVLTIPVRE